MTPWNRNERSYKKGCQPPIKGVFGGWSPSRGDGKIFCCNSAECNRDVPFNFIPDAFIQCYTCDSRITGQKDCSVLNASSPSVYRAGSNSREESCAVSDSKEKERKI